MKRDFDLLRCLLLRIEGGEYSFDVVGDEVGASLGLNESETLTQNQADKLDHHFTLLLDAGLIDGQWTGSGIVVNKITWQGHDFLDSVRDPEIWQKTKEGAEAAGGFTVDILGALAKGFIKTKIKEHTGIDL